MYGFHCFKVVQRGTSEGLSMPLRRVRQEGDGTGCGTVLINSVTSYLGTRSCNKPSDSPAGLLPVLSPSTSYAFPFAGLAQTVCCIGISHLLLTPRPHVCLRRPITTATLCGRPQWTAMDSFLNPNPIIYYILRNRQCETILRNLWKYQNGGGVNILMTTLICVIPMPSSPIVLDFIFLWNKSYSTEVHMKRV